MGYEKDGRLAAEIEDFALICRVISSRENGGCSDRCRQILHAAGSDAGTQYGEADSLSSLQGWRG
jgi:hypothetical protein